MALNDLNKNAIAFKKLVGKSHTNQTFAYNEESVSSNVQMSYSTVFGAKINPIPQTSGLTTLYSTDGVVELLNFQISIIPDTQIGSNQSQGYEIKLPSDYSTFGALKSKFSSDTVLSTALGKLQIVPALYGQLQLDGTTQYDPVLTDASSNVITKFDPIDWIIDPYSGTLFVQSPPSGYDLSPNKPAFVKAYLYVGQYLNDAIESGITATVNVDDVTIGQSGVTEMLYVKQSAIDASKVKISSGANVLNAPLQSDGLGGFKFGVITNNITGLTASSGLTIFSGSSSFNPILYLDIDSTLHFVGNKVGVDKIGISQILTGSTSNAINANYIPIFSGSTYSSEPSVGLAIESFDNRITSLESTTFNGVTGATNLSGGTGIYASYAMNNLLFKSLVGGNSIVITSDANNVIISYTGNTGGTVQNIYQLKRIISGTTTLLGSDFIVYCQTNAGGFTINLPLAPVDGQVYKIKDIGNALINNIIINGNGKNIDGSSTIVIDTQNGGVEISYETLLNSWFILSFIS